MNFAHNFLFALSEKLWFDRKFYWYLFLISRNISSDDDSDADLVTDYLGPTLINSTTIAVTAKTSTPTQAPNIKNYFISTVDIKEKGSMSSGELGFANGASNFTPGSQNNTITITTPSGHSGNIINNNMVPIISVTPHSPGAKYNCILEDSLNHLQSIRETVVQMKNSSAQNSNFSHIGTINPTVKVTLVHETKLSYSQDFQFSDDVIKDFLLMSVVAKSKCFERNMVCRSKRNDIHSQR